MQRKNLMCVAVSACAVLTLVLGSTASADDKDKPALSGVWAKKGGELKLEFADKDVLKISPHGKDDVILIVCKYTVDKEGLVKAKITELEGKEKDKAKELIPVGLEFSLKWKVKNDTATLDDLKGENVEILKSHLEGEYDKK